MSEFGPWVTGVIMALLAFLGLGLAAGAVDGVFYMFGLLLTLFGVLFIFGLITRYTSHD